MTAALPGPWRFGPVEVRMLPHRAGARGEPQVRGLLGAWLQVEDAALPLVRDAHGRPRLQAPFDDRDAGWSHSGEHLLLACGRDVRLGVDLERMRARPRALELAQRFFDPEEAARLEATAPALQHEAFVRLWCAKEAVLKAHGRGIAFGLERLRFAPAHAAPEAPLRLQACDPALGRPGDWHLHEWAPGAGYRAAVAWHPL